MPYKDKNKQKERNRIWGQSKNGKEGEWRRMGIIIQDNLYERYTNTKKCEICNVDLVLGYKSKNRKCIDHHHLSGYVRDIVCNTCNVKRRVIDTKTLKVNLHLHRYFNRQ